MSSCSSIILKNNGNVTFVSNPSITYFKSVYRKHTKFSIDYKEEAGGNFTTGGGPITIELNYAADLLCDISLRVQYKPDLPVESLSIPHDIALHLIKDITLNLRGQLSGFDEIDKRYINFNAMLNNPSPLKATYTVESDGKLTCNNGNNFQNMALCGGITGSSGNLDNIQTMDAIIPLPFAFSKSIGTAIPLCALNQTTMKPLLIITPADDKGSDTGWTENVSSSFYYSAISKFIFLSDEEISRFKSARLEYLYERVVRLTTSTSTGTVNISRLNNKHPIKQIILNRLSGNIKYEMFINNTGGFSDAINHAFFEKVEILNKFKGQWIKGRGQSGGVGIIDFSLKNTEGPSGCISPSNNVINLKITGAEGMESTWSIDIYTVCYYLLRISDGELSYVFN